MNNIKLDEESARLMAELITDITAEREKQGLSQSKLSELAGIKQSALSRMESLKAFPQLDTLYKILQPLNLKLAVKPKNQLKEYKGMKISNQNIKKLQVETNFCHLSITTSNDSDFHMVTNKEDEFILEKTEDSIIIKQKKRNVLKWLFNWIPIEIKVTVPAGFAGETEFINHNGKASVYSINLDSVSIKNRNGTLECEDFNAGEVYMHSGNGTIEIQGANFKSLDSHSSNGRIQLFDVNSEEFIKAKTSNGRVIVKNCTAKSFDFKSSNGSIIVEGSDSGALIASTSNGRIIASMRGNQADYAIDFSTSNGAIYLGNEKTHGRYVIKKEGSKLEAHTSNGSIRFRFADTVDTGAFDSDSENNPDILAEEIEALFAAKDEQNIN